MRKILVCLLHFIISNTLFSQQCDSIYTDKMKGIGEINKIINHSQIEQNHFKSLSQLLNEQAGFVINGAYQTAGSFINIYSEGALGAKTLILIDGLPVWDPSSISDDYFDLNFISLNEIEEIIIYKTAQSPTFGSGAICGAINIITKKAKSCAPFNLKMSQGIGNLNTLTSSIQFWGAKSKFNYQFSYSTAKSTGFSYANDSIGNQGFDNDGFTNKIFNSRIEYNPSNKLSFYGTCLYSHYKASTDIEAFIDTKDYNYTNSFLNTAIGGRYNIKNMQITADFKISRAVRDYQYAPLNTEHWGGLTQFAKLELSSKLSRQISVLVGFDYRNSQLTNNAFDTVNGASALSFPNAFQYSIYSGINYLTSDSTFSINLKGRMNVNSLSTTNNTFSVSSNFELTKHVNLFSSISTGYLAPSLFESKDINLGNPNLVSENSTSYAIGFELNRLHLENRICFLYNVVNNIIDYNFNASAYANCDKLKATLVEYDFRSELSNSFLLYGNYTFQIGKEQTISRQNFTDTITYDYLVRRPKNNLNLNLNYHYNNHFSITLNGKYVSNYYDVGLGSNDFLMKGFGLLNLNINAKIYRGLTADLGIQNLLNTTFYDTRGFNSIPRIVNIGLSAAF